MKGIDYGIVVVIVIDFMIMVFLGYMMIEPIRGMTRAKIGDGYMSSVMGKVIILGIGIVISAIIMIAYFRKII